MRRILFPLVFLLCFAAGARAESAVPPLFEKPGFFVEPQFGYARLDGTNRDLGAFLVDAGVMVPTGDWFAHDLRLQLGYVGNESAERDVYREKYTRGTFLCPVTVGYTLHAMLPGRVVSVYAGPRVGGVVAGIYERDRVGCDCYGDPIYDDYNDTELLFSWGGDAGVHVSLGKTWGVDLGYSYRRIEGADFNVRGRGEVWPAQGLHMIRLGVVAKF